MFAELQHFVILSVWMALNRILFCFVYYLNTLMGLISQAHMIPFIYWAPNEISSSHPFLPPYFVKMMYQTPQWLCLQRTCWLTPWKSGSGPKPSVSSCANCSVFGSVTRYCGDGLLCKDKCLPVFFRIQRLNLTMFQHFNGDDKHTQEWNEVRRIVFAWLYGRTNRQILYMTSIHGFKELRKCLELNPPDRIN